MQNQVTEKSYERKKIITIGMSAADINFPDYPIEMLIESNTLHVYACEKQIYCALDDVEVIAGQHYPMKKESHMTIGECEIRFLERVFIISASNSFYQTKLLEVQTECLEFEGFPNYTRSPRIIKKVPKDTIEIRKPPEKAIMNKTSLAEMIVPPVLMAGVTVAVGLLTKAGAFMMLSTISTIMTLIFTVTKYFNEKKQCKRKNKHRIEKYESYLLEERKELNQARNQEIEAWSYNYPTIEKIEKLVLEYSPRLYERSLQDDDFLTISVGYTKAPVSFRITCDDDSLDNGDDELADEEMKLKEEFGSIDEKPVVIDLKKAHLGIVGYKENIHEQLKLIVSQLAFAQSYHDLQIVVIYNKTYDDEFSWMRWFPHCKIQSLNLRGIINSEHMRDQVLGSIHQILKDRKMKWEEKKNDAKFSPYFVFIIDDPKLISSHAIMEYLDKDGNNIAFSIIYTTQMMANLPDNIGTVVELLDSQKGKVVLQEKQFVNQEMNLYHVGNVRLDWISRNLSVLNHEQGIVSQIPESITFYDMYQIQSAHELHAEERWKKNQSHKSLAVPLGVRGNEEYVYLNLHEKAHGPHGLVAGTTGSGKSEIIQSYILSLAVNFHPYEVGFLLIDYKGGGMAGLFKNLPHLLGTITNLDGTESLRAMASIKSELLRRQKIFSEHGVNHINGYNKLFKNGEADIPIPHLFLISDEFAELKKEQPEFMAELISTARIGRSLGVHLILATQKPSGVVDDQIWSNSKFKLALKVQDEGDSREILKTPDAAFITQAGRAYLQVGNNEIYELFQSAWSGATVDKEGEEEKVDNRVYLINELGQGELLNDDLDAATESNEKKETQLDAIVDYINEVFEKQHCARVPKPWLPSLPYKMVNPVQEVESSSKVNLSVSLGMVDIPDQQSQEEFILDLEQDGNFGYFAAGGYGKSMMLTNCILTLARRNKVSSLNFYIFDFGNSALIPLKDLAHTADYITYDDVEKRNKFFKLIQVEMKARKQAMAKIAAQNFSVYNQMVEKPLKAIVIVVDNMDILKEIGIDEEEEFTKIARDGSGLGIYLIFSALNENSVRYGTMNNIKVKIAGYMYDQSDISSIVGRGAFKLPDKKGRAMVKYKGINIMQVYTAVPFEDEIDYIEQLKHAVVQINEAYPGEAAPKIPVLPEIFHYEQMKEYEVSSENPDVLLGLNVEEVKLEGLSRNQSPFVIIGESGRGKTNMLKCILNQLDEMQTVYLFDSRSRELNSYKGMDGLTYVQSDDQISSFVNEMTDIGNSRGDEFSMAMADNEELTMKEFISWQQPVYVIVDGTDEFIERINEDYEDTIAEILEKASSLGVVMIFSVHSAKFHGYDDLSGFIKKANYGLVLGDQGSSDIFPVSYQDTIEFTRGFLFNNGNKTKVMLPEC